MKKNICVYTCVTGTYDDLKDPTIIEDNIDYYCFTNNKNIKSNVWKIIYVEDFSLSNHLLSRKIKILGNEMINGKYDIYVWLDASIIIKKEINKFIDKYCDLSQYDYFSFKHNCRNSILEEMKAVVFYGKESPDNIKRLKEFYNKENYLYDNGLGENGIIIRKYNNSVMSAMKTWFDMLINYSERDQLSFNYAASVNKLNFKHINLNIWNNEWFEVQNHLAKKNKYYIHFKQKISDDIDEYTDGDKIFIPFSIIDNMQNIEICVPKKCKYIDLELSGLCGYLLDNYSIKSEIDITEEFIFFNKLDRYLIFNQDGCILRLNGKFDANDEIIIGLNLIPNTQNYVIEIIKNYEHTMEKKIEELDAMLIKKNEEYNKIINSKRWKLVDKAFNIKK